ncbi:hypothetical protein [Lacticaseibacillus brantae]|uniref:Uncharacterized protein n=1 Tax=Lacticaseibacillus brantae DSM 23927 TaxID=1423727 RepID=A0A0R2B8U6_9LACO|nr:hypothetical protein [Lacticaseibacillus brantae]KRM72012.1 hypothetical protein FC34_GL000994 [Lacticaseibacillus brantae DSM 23927]
MKPEFSSVFDIMGRLAITPNQEHIDMAFRLGQALQKWLGTPQSVSWQLDGPMAEASFNQTMTLAVTAGLIGVSTLVGEPNILEFAFKHQIHVDYVPNAGVQPTTAALVIDRQQTLVFATQATADTFAITQINRIPVQLVPGQVSLLLVVKQPPSLDQSAYQQVSPLIDLGAGKGMIVTPKLPTPALIKQLSALPDVLKLTVFR